jgi:hypothetical protein
MDCNPSVQEKEMSIIDLTDQTTPAITLMNAVCNKFARDDIRACINLPEGSEVEVKLTVNGVEIDFATTVQELWDQCNRDADGRALTMAKDIIKGAGLEKVREAVERAEWEISNALDESLKQIKEAA